MSSKNAKILPLMMTLVVAVFLFRMPVMADEKTPPIAKSDTNITEHKETVGSTTTYRLTPKRANAIIGLTSFEIEMNEMNVTVRLNTDKLWLLKEESGHW